MSLAVIDLFCDLFEDAPLTLEGETALHLSIFAIKCRIDQLQILVGVSLALRAYDMIYFTSNHQTETYYSTAYLLLDYVYHMTSLLFSG